MKKLLSLFLSIVMLLSITAGIDFSAYADTFSGTCGENVSWKFDTDTGLLTISGNGNMADRDYDSYAPWYDYRYDIITIDIKYGVTSIGDWAFSYCDSLTSITIPDSVTSIGDHAFEWCSSLTSIIIPSSVTSIGEDAFFLCDSLTSIVVNESNENYLSLDGVLFNKDKTLLIKYPAGNENTSYTIPDSVTSIGDWAFFECASLTSITIPDSVTSIGDSAFSSCTSLTSITIPDSVTSIGDEAFFGCDSLTSIAIPDSVTSIGRGAFAVCRRLISIVVNENNKNYSSLDGTLFNKDITLLIQYPIGNKNTSYIIPDGVTSIGDHAFDWCSSLTSITIPDGVTSIGWCAFYYCRSLRDVYYGGTQSDWNNISIASNNNCLTNATIHYNSKMPPTFIEKQLRFENEIYLMNVNNTKEIKAYICDVYLDNGNLVYENKVPVDGNKLNWSTNVGEENKVISFDQNGKVTALSEGLAYLSAYVKDDINLYASCQIYVGNPNSLKYKATYDTKQYYTDGGFFSQTSSMSDCVELYFLFENKLADELQDLEDKLSLDDLSDISPITLTASVSGKDLSFSRDSYQNTYRATFDSISAGKSIDDILMLFPYNINIAPSGNNYTVKVKLESESFETVTEEYSFTVENLENKSANEHISFTSNSYDYIESKNNHYGETMVSLKDDTEYKWSKYSSFDFKNYYEVVLADILIEVLNVNQVELPSLVPSVLKEWVGTYKTLLSGITTIVKEDYTGNLDISETKIDKLLKKSKYTTEGIYTNDELYQTVLDLLGNADNSKKITKVFSTIDKTQQVVGFIKLGKNVIKDIVDWGNRITLLNEYSKANTEFKNVMKKFADSIPDDQKKMREAVYDYINYSADISSQINELLESFSEMLGSVTLDVFKSCIGKSLFNYFGIQVFNWIGSITLSSGVILSATPAFAGVQTAFGAFFAGATLGLCLSDVLCESSGKSQEMSKVVAMSEFSPYIIDTLNYYESNLYNQRNDGSVDVFEYSFALHKATQSYIMNHTIKSLEIKRDSLIIKIFGRDDYDGLISDILAQKAVVDALKCHSSGKDGETLSVKTKVIAIKCPVNVFFYDNDGKEIVRIINDTKEYVAEDINVLIDGDKKYIALPVTQNYSTKIVATDEGKMEYLVTEYDEGAQRLRSVNKTDIPLVSEKTFTGEITEEMNPMSEEYALTNDEEVVLPDKVIDNPITGVELNYKNLDLNIGEESKLIATVTPVNVTNSKVRWVSDNPSIANVDDKGNITTISTGKTTIYVVTEDWGYVDSCTVSVNCTHRYDSGKITKSATCKATGIKTFTCTACSDVYTETIDKIAHTYKEYTTKATTSKNGSVVTKCSVCGEVKSKSTIYYPKTIQLSKTSYTYNGKVQTPTVTVKDSKGKTLKKDTDYTVTYAKGRKNVGKYSVKITFKGNYSGTKTLTFEIVNKPVNKWIKSGNRWWYRHADGSYTRNNWEKISGKWYHFDKSGWMQTGWLKDGGKWYYLNSSGVMTTGWVKVSNKWYYMNSSGVMQTGWVKLSGKWYYMNSSGVMLTGRQKIGNKYYTFNSNGVWVK